MHVTPVTIPTTIRLRPSEKAALQRLADGAGLSLSDYVRREMGLRGEAADIHGLDARLDDHERRISRLEGMAGLD